MLDSFKKYLNGLRKPKAEALRIAVPTAYGVRKATFASMARGLEPAQVAGVMASALTGNAERWFALAEEMEERYPHYAAQIATRKRALAGLPLRVEAASTEERDIDIAAFVEANLPPIRAALFDMGDAIAKGIAIMELEWKVYPDGRWGIADATRVDPRWLRFDAVDLTTPLLASDVAPEGEPLEEGRFFTLTMPQKSGLPMRGGLAWCAVWPFLFQNFSLKDWVTFVERFGKPVRLGVYDQTASEADIAVLTEAVASIGEDMGAVISSNLKLDFPQAAGGTGSGAWPELLKYLDEQVSKLVIGQTLSADSGSTGLGSGVAGLQGDVRRDILLADAAMVEAALNRDLIPLLTRLNFGDAPCPKAVLDTTQEEDLQARMNVVKTAVELGFKVSTTWFSDTFKIPLAEEGESVLAGGVQGGGSLQLPTSMHREQDAPATLDAGHAAAWNVGQELDGLADAALDDWQPQLDGCLTPVLEAIAEAAEKGETAEQVLARLPLLLEQMDSSVLEARLAKAMMVAQCAGTALP
ncbi:MAG: DUF935 domain-containing protein [Zoogloeaceae bacterium]|jgi:phage gp29-like protein|nr:DUF935 domain-containing protein [Zoogloeaceae bacterium]